MTIENGKQEMEGQKFREYAICSRLTSFIICGASPKDWPERRKIIRPPTSWSWADNMPPIKKEPPRKSETAFFRLLDCFAIDDEPNSPVSFLRVKLHKYSGSVFYLNIESVQFREISLDGINLFCVIPGCAQFLHLPFPAPFQPCFNIQTIFSVFFWEND